MGAAGRDHKPRRMGFHEDDAMTDSPRFFQTTAIDYPNSRPHIGTAFEKLGADVQARYRRMEGYDVHFLMATTRKPARGPSRPPGWGKKTRGIGTTRPGRSRRCGGRWGSGTNTST